MYKGMTGAIHNEQATMQAPLLLDHSDDLDVSEVGHAFGNFVRGIVGSIWACHEINLLPLPKTKSLRCHCKVNIHHPLVCKITKTKLLGAMAHCHSHPATKTRPGRT